MRIIRTLALLGAVLALWPMGVQASCVGPRPVATALLEAPTAFVGTVQGVAYEGRLADVLVESVWKGEGVTTHVLVDGRLSPGAVTSVDRTFEVGARMLFLPQGERSPYMDSSCSPTTGYSEDLAALKPAAAHPPLPGGEVQAAAAIAGPSLLPLAGVTVALVIAVAAVLGWRRRRARR